MENKVADVTVDFIIQYKTGNYLCRKKTNKLHITNHLNAVSFDTRAQAKSVAHNAKVLKRICKLEECE